jgi:type I restriction enzyme S subunit
VKSIKLGEVAKIYNGNSINKKVKANNFTGLKIGTPYIATKDISYACQVNYENGVMIPSVNESEFKLAKKGSVLLCAEGGSAGRKMAIIERDVFFGNKLFCFECDATLNSKFLFYYLQTSTFQDLFKSSITGLIGGVSLEKVRNLPIVLPSLEKQSEIVEKLDAAFACIESLNENGSRAQHVAESLLSQLIGSWINSETARKKVNLGELAELKGRIGWRGLTAKEYTKEGPLFLSVHSLNHGHFVDFSRAFHISKERYDESPEIHLAEGYILIAKDGAGLGKVGMVGKIQEPTTVNSSLLVVKPKAEIQTKYLYCYFLSSDFQELIKDRLGGSTVPHLYQRDIAKIPVTLLSPEQQLLFIEKFDLSSQILEDLIENLKNKNNLLLELKSALLSAEFVAA